MRSVAVGVRLLRRRKGWRQADLARLALVSQPTVSRIERGELERVTIGALSRCVRQLDARLLIDLRVHGESIADFADATHAALQNWVAGYLVDAGWQVRPEVSFNHYGDRGRIDVLAAHPMSGLIACAAGAAWRGCDGHAGSPRQGSSPLFGCRIFTDRGRHLGASPCGCQPHAAYSARERRFSARPLRPRPPPPSRESRAGAWRAAAIRGRAPRRGRHAGRSGRPSSPRPPREHARSRAGRSCN